MHNDMAKEFSPFSHGGGGGRPARRGRQCRARCPTPPAWGKQGQQIGAPPFSPNHAVGVIPPSNAVYNACHSTRLRAESSNKRKMTEWGTRANSYRVPCISSLILIAYLTRQRMLLGQSMSGDGDYRKKGMILRSSYLTAHPCLDF